MRRPQLTIVNGWRPDTATPTGLECASTSTKYATREVEEIDRALAVLKKYKLGNIEAYRRLYAIRGRIQLTVGLKIPRPTSLLRVLAGLSPGTIKLWHDAESGWFSEARERLGAPPVYKHVGDEVAMAILKGELTHELEAELMKPDNYLGE